MLGNIAISIICGTIYGLSAWALGAPFPLALGIISGLLDLIPMVGATIAGVIVVLATLTQGVTPAVIMLVIVLVYQQFENYVLQPTILGKAADVSGFVVIARSCSSGRCSGWSALSLPCPSPRRFRSRCSSHNRPARTHGGSPCGSGACGNDLTFFRAARRVPDVSQAQPAAGESQLRDDLLAPLESVGDVVADGEPEVRRSRDDAGNTHDRHHREEHLDDFVACRTAGECLLNRVHVRGSGCIERDQRAELDQSKRPPVDQIGSSAGWILGE